MALSKLRSSFATATNEITFAAANLNLDFSLFKFEAPTAYQPFGLGLSSRRRNEAEYGTIHTTARKLGALFEQTIPSTPKLVDAYGTRVSTIATQSDVNPQGSIVDGLFSGHVGADGTTIWAAATSGPGAVPVHLLACLLARRWNAPYAISIWVEIVEERKKEVAESFEKDNQAYYPTLQAARQEISREQLAEWDASARAWLRTADEAMREEVDRLRSVVAGLNLPIDENSNLYNSVMHTWKLAMTTIEKILDGQPQTIYNGSALLGLSSWHIFPDVVVLQNPVSELQFKDSLVKIGGTLTVGLEIGSVDEGFDVSGVQWSLSLAHLRYYGPPISASTSLENDNSRIYFNEFTSVILGAVAPVLHCSFHEAAGFFSACLDQITGLSGSQPISFKMPRDTTKDQVRDYLAKDGKWFNILARASSAMLDSSEQELKTTRMLMKCGERHGRGFFCPPSEDYGRLFGICNPQILLKLLPNSNLRVNLLRRMASRVHPGGTELLIRYKADQGPLDTQPADETSAVVWEFATALLQDRKSSKRDHEDKKRFNSRHKRWVQLDVFSKSQACMCTTSCENCSCSAVCTSACHPTRSQANCIPDDDILRHDLRAWCSYMESLNEDSEVVLDPWTAIALSSGASSFGQPNCRAEEFYFSREKDEKPVRYLLVAGNPDSAALYIPTHVMSGQHQPKVPGSSDYANSLTVQDVVELIQSNDLSAHRLLATIRNLDATALNAIEVPNRAMQPHLFRSLRAVGLADSIYKMLPSATVAVRAISLPLYKSAWVPQSFRASTMDSNSLDRSRTFACVAMFESGHLNLEPTLLKEVFALSSVDSLFVTSSLVCDPSEVPHEFELKRVVGNVGRAGMAFLIPPQVPDIKKVDLGSWNFVAHADFDGSAENCFRGTSMHLSFSGYKLPLHTGIHGSQDVDAYLLESIIQVRDKGKWVADIDVLSAIESNIGQVDRHPEDKFCGHELLYESDMGLTCIDTWEELLEAPEKTAVARAHGNWLGRLALTCVAAHKDYNVYILPPTFCWKCAVYVSNHPNRPLALKTLLEGKKDFDIDIGFGSPFERGKTPNSDVGSLHSHRTASTRKSRRQGAMTKNAMSRSDSEEEPSHKVGDFRKSPLDQYVKASSGGSKRNGGSAASSSSRHRMSPAVDGMSEGTPPPVLPLFSSLLKDVNQHVSKDRIVLIL